MIENNEELNEDNAREEHLALLTLTLCKKRSEAISGRLTSGIEDEWQEDEDSYQGIDEANRSSTGKPISHTGGSIGVKRNKTTRSTAFINITRPYVDAASARVSDILLPYDDRNWSIRPTPIPDLIEGLSDQTPVVDQAGNQAVYTPPATAASPGMFNSTPQNIKGIGDLPKGQVSAVPAPQGPRPMVAGDAAAIQMDKARKQAEGAQTQIDDWHVECQYNFEVRKVIEDVARIGTGVLKGPTPKKTTTSSIQYTPDGNVSIIKESKIIPASYRVSPWNLFPDPNCGESIHNGSYVFERGYVTARQLMALAGLPGYSIDAIMKVIEEGPNKSRETSKVKPRDDDRFEIWYYNGFLEKKDLDSMGVECDEALSTFPVIVSIVNDTIIKAALSPLESGSFPYDVFTWERRQDSPWGYSLSHQISTAQRMLNAATRNMLDNAAISAGPQIVIRKGVVVPADNQWEIRPRKIWYVNEDADSAAVNQAFMAIQIPSMQKDLSNIIDFALRMAEQTTGMQMLISGQQGQQGPAGESLGGMTLLMNNASTALRRLAKTFDENVTKPHIKRYYEWLMLYGDDENIKGDYVIDARGSSALVERDIQNQAILQMGQLVMNPSFGINPKRWFEEACKAQRLDPKRFQFTEDEMQQMQAAAAQNKPVDPRIEAVKIKADADLQKATINAQLQEKRIQVDTDRDRAYVDSMRTRDQTHAQARMAELQIKRELAMLEYANNQKIALDQVKARLAETSMKLKTQKELSLLSTRANVHMKTMAPPTEPAGKAPDGKSFER